MQEAVKGYRKMLPMWPRLLRESAVKPPHSKLRRGRRDWLRWGRHL